MEVHEIHRGRLIDHLQLVVSDLEASKKFYSAAFKALEIPWGGVPVQDDFKKDLEAATTDDL